MSWFLPAITACALLTLPGYIVLRVVGARLALRAGWAPPVTVLLTVLLTGVYRLLGIPWHIFSAILGYLLIAAIGVVARRVCTRTGDRGRTDSAHSSRGRPRPGIRARGVIAGTAIASGLFTVAMASSRMGGIDTLNGSYDAFFHLSSIAFIRDGGDAFLTTALTEIYGESTFYPVVWGALASLLPFGVVTSANAMVLGMLIALPLAVAAMLVSVFEEHRAAPAAAVLGAAASTIFLSTPAMALVMGLWPIVLGVLCLPVALAAVRRLTDDPRGAPTPWSAAGYVAIILGAALAHPSMVFSLAVVLGLLLLARGVERVVRNDGPRRGTVQVLVALGAVGAYVVGSETLLAGMAMTRPSRDSLSSVFVQVLVDTPRIPVFGSPLWPMILLWILAVIGTVRAVRRGESPGITAALGVVMTVLLGLATQINNPLAIALVNPWYGARERIAPLMMCLLIILAGRGLLVLVDAGLRVPQLRAAAPVALGLLLATVIVALVVPQRIVLMGSLAYTAYGVQLSPYVTPAERDFIERTAGALPEDAVVLADPRDGATLYWSVGGIETVYPTMARPQTRDAQLLGTYSASPDERGEVCGSFERIGPTHLYRDTSEFSGMSMNPEASAPWSGIHDIPDSALTLVESDGPYALYELEAPC